MGFAWVREVLDKLLGVGPHEVSQVPGARRRWPRAAVTVEGFELLTIWGRTLTGRPLMVALRRKDEWDWWIVGARELDRDEVIQMEQWEARND